MKNSLRSKNLPFVATGIPTPFCNPKTKTTSSLKGFLTLVVMVMLFGVNGVMGQIYLHDFGTTDILNKPYTDAPSTFATNLNTSSWTTSASGWSGLAGSSGESLSLSNSSGTPTYTLTFNVASGFQVAISHFNFWRVRSTAGAQNWAMTINGTSVGSGTVPTTGASIGSTAVNSTISGLTGTITIILTMSGATGTGTFRLDDFTLTGSVTASSSAPSLAITGTTAHGSACVGSSTSAIQYTITNSGTTEATGVSVASSNSSEFAISTALSSTTIASNGGTVTYSVTFTPSATGASTSTVTATSTTSGSNSPTSSLTGTGTTPVTQAVTSSAASSITAKSATLNGNYTTLGVCPATTEKGFVYSLTSDNNDPLVSGTGVTKTTVNLGSTGAYTLALTNLPSSSGYSFKAYVYNGTTYTYGTVQTFTTSAALAISGTISNGTVCPNVTASPITYTVTNNGATTVTGVSIASSDPQFVVSSISSSSIAAAGTATYTVTFTPTSAGSKSATVTVSGTSVVSVTSIPTGTGTTPVTQAVTSSTPTPISYTTATLKGTVNALGVCPSSTQKGFVYSLTSANSDPVNAGSGVTTTSVTSLVTGAYSLALTGLTAESSYTFKAYIYDGTTYTYGASTTFSTLTLTVPGAPTIGTATVSGTTASVPFTAPASNGGSTITTYTATSSPGGITSTLTQAGSGTVTVSGLTLGQAYTFTVTATNAIGTGSVSSTSNSVTPAYCTSTGPSSAGTDYFTNFTASGSAGGINNTSAFSTNGYGNFTAQSVSQSIGGSVIYSATTPGIANGSSFGIFVDWNQDGDFADTNETAVSLGASTQITVNPSGNFTVPVGALLGSTRMRIVVKDATGAVNSCNSAQAISETEDYTVTIIASSPTSSTWDGTAWSNGAPTSSLDAIIAGNYSTTTNGVFSAKTLTVNSGKSFTINTGHNITVAGAVTNGGTLTIANNANLVQTDVAATNTGSIIVNRNSANIQLYDYTLWSSPVTNANQFLTTFSPSTLATRFYTYNFTDNLYNVVSNPAGTTFDIAKGYLIRAPNTWTAGASAAPFSGTFTGVPNNGTIPVTLNYTDAARSYNLVGNPYPSTIDAETFLTVNSSSIENALYFWRKTNGASGSAYATYTLGGATTSTPTSAAPNGTIQVGQGFFVKAKSATTLNFTNAMRLTSASTQFFRTTSEIERNRIWLNLTNTSGVFSQMLVGYMTDATLDVDSLDGKYINDSPFALTSLINSEEYTIQGKPLPFDTNDTVPLGFKTNAAGNFSIGIDHVDGLFSNGQTIYLKDNLTNTAHNLSSGDYSFASDAGTYNSRFEIVYQSALVLPTFTANNVIVYSQNGEITINSGTMPMNQVRIFDVRGRLLAEKNHINATETKLTVGAQNQVLLVKIGTTEGSEVTKKIIQ